MFRSISARKALILSSAISAVSFCSQTQAQTWLNPVSGNWSIPTNWFGGVAPVSGPTTALTFGASGAASYAASNNNAGSFSLNSVTSTSTSSGLITIDTNAISFGGTAPAINSNGTGAIQINNPVELAAHTTVGGTGSGTVILTGALNSNPASDGLVGFGLIANSATSVLSINGGGTIFKLQSNRGVTNVGGANLIINSQTAPGINAAPSPDVAVSAGNVVGVTSTINFSSAQHTTGNIYAGNMAGSTGVVNISGAGTVVNTDLTSFAFGRIGTFKGTGTFNINSGANVRCLSLEGTRSSDSSVTYNIDGAGTLVRAEQILLGREGTNNAVANMNITGGAEVRSQFNIGSGDVILAGSVNAKSTLSITNGQFISDGYVGIAAPDLTDSTNSATLSVNGSSSVINSPSAIAITNWVAGAANEPGGTSRILITNGGKVTFGELDMGYFTQSTGTLLVSGSGSELNLASDGVATSGFFDTGMSDQAFVHVRYEAAAKGTSAADTSVGAFGGATVDWTVTGAGTSFSQAIGTDLNTGDSTLSNLFDVGGAYTNNNGSLVTGVVNVLNGGTMSVDFVRMGIQTASNSTINVDGTDSEFDASFGFLALGGAGANATVNVTNGAVADFGLQLTAAGGSATVTTLRGTATMNVNTGGLLTTEFLEMATNVGTAILNVDGADSQAILSAGSNSNIIMADAAGAVAVMNVTNGGAVGIIDAAAAPPVLDGAIFVADAVGAVGTINLSGTDSFIGAGFLGVAGSGANPVSQGTAYVNQSGGDMTLGAASVYNNGTYNLSGGTYDSFFTNVDGRFNYSGGSASVGDLVVAGNFNVTPGNNKTVSAFTVTTTGTGKVELSDNAMVVDDTTTSAATQLASIRSQIISGINSGTGIVSSTVSANPTRKGIGVIKASDTGSTSFRGVPVTNTGVLVRTTYLGDTDLDGDVESNDFNRLAAKYGQTAGSNWIDGDFNYDGKVNTVDFNFLAGNFGATVLPGPTAGSTLDMNDSVYTAVRGHYSMNKLDGLTSELGLKEELALRQRPSFDGLPAPTLGSVVPEPTSLAVLGLAGLGLAGRRRRA